MTVSIAQGVVIIYGRGWGRRENGWVTEKMETARLGMRKC